MLHTITLAIEADTAVSDGKQQQLKGTDSPRNKNKKIHTMGVCKGLLLSAITGEKGVTCSSCAGTHSHAVWFGWIYLAGQPLNGQTDSRVSNSQIFWVSKYVGTRKKSEQTMKFQVLVVQCGIASSLSGLIAWQQMLGECHSSCKKAESNVLPALDSLQIYQQDCQLWDLCWLHPPQAALDQIHITEDEGDGKVYLEKMIVGTVDISGLILSTIKPPMAHIYTLQYRSIVLLLSPQDY